MNKLKTIQLILLILLVAGINLKTTGQTTDKFIRVGDTTINLNDVDLEKGMKIKGKQFVKKGDDDSPMNYRTSFNVFTSPERDYYAIVFNTTNWYEGSYYSDINVELKYYNKHDEKLFKKRFDHLFVFNLYISASGETVICELINEDAEQVFLINKKGEVLKKYDNYYERLYAGPTHNCFLICNHNEYKGPNTYDNISANGDIEEVDFPPGHLTQIEFSPKEDYYLVYYKNEQLLYSCNNEFIWKKPTKDGIINFINDKSYLIHYYDSNYIVTKDLLSHETKFIVDSVIYNEKKFPIYFSDIIDGDFFVIGKNDSIFIYNFYNTDGRLLQVKTVPYIRVNGNPYRLSKINNGYKIKSWNQQKN